MRVLVIEDSPDMARLMEHIFRRDEVRFATRLSQALDMIHDDRPFDLVVADLFLPDSQPPQTIAKIRTADRNTTLIATSGYPTAPEISELCDGFISKADYGTVAQMQAFFQSAVRKVREERTHEKIVKQLEACEKAERLT